MNSVFPQFAGYRVPLLTRLLRQESRWCDDVTTRSVIEECSGGSRKNRSSRQLDWIEQKQGKDMAL